MATLRLTRLAGGDFSAEQGGAAVERWTLPRLRAFLLHHGYDADAADWIAEQADAAPQIEINVPEPDAG